MLLSERKKILTETVKHRLPKRILNCSQTRAWPISDAGYKLKEAFSSLEKYKEALFKCQENYDFDMYTSFIRFQYSITEALGGGGLVINDSKGSIEYEDTAFMQENEYPLLVKQGLVKFLYEQIFPLKYGLSASHEESLKMIKSALKEQKKLNELKHEIELTFRNTYGVAKDTNSFLTKTPIDMLCLCLRGVKEFSKDLRRIDDSVIFKALDAIDGSTALLLDDRLKSFEETDYILYPNSVNSTTVSFLSAKQFEKFDWPYLKKICDVVVKNDSRSLLFPIGSFSHLTDCFQELPKGHFTMIAEMDDIAFLMKKLPNMSFIGGFPTYLLGHASKEECVRKAKEVIDAYACDRSYIFSTDKMLNVPQDALGENLRAVNEFVKDYGVYE